jgi:beta-lactamase regulating signal transducer with metallopeptidase domain
MDILWGEWLCILNWYNPFAWMIRRSIRQNLEFIADNKVLENGIDKKQYQYLLLKVTGSPQFTIGASFNLSSLKKRIAMMNKIKSARVHLLRFLLLFPCWPYCCWHSAITSNRYKAV